MEKRQKRSKIHKYKDKYILHDVIYTWIQNVKIWCSKKNLELIWLQRGRQWKILVESRSWRDRNLKFGPNCDLEVNNLEKKIKNLARSSFFWKHILTGWHLKTKTSCILSLIPIAVSLLSDVIDYRASMCQNDKTSESRQRPCPTCLLAGCQSHRVPQPKRSPGRWQQCFRQKQSWNYALL